MTVDFSNLIITLSIGIPDSPSNVMVHTDTFTSSSVNISWTESSSPCVTNYRYNVSSTTINGTTTSNSVVLEGLVPSDDTLCVEVATVDTADRTNSSDPVCFVFNGNYILLYNKSYSYLLFSYSSCCMLLIC